MWVGSLIWIYFDPPGHQMWYQFVPNVTLVAVQFSQFKFNIFKPIAFAFFVGLIVYVLIMPQLHVFWQLGIVIMVFTFIAAYYFTGLVRIAIYLSMYNMLAIQNNQIYNFAAQANAFLFTLLAIVLASAMTYMMRSPRQEKEFLILLNRFFKSGEFLISGTNKTKDKRSILYHIKKAYYLQELQTIPEKLELWGTQVDLTQFTKNKREQVVDIINKVQMIAYRIEDYLKIQALLQSNMLVNKMQHDINEWESSIIINFDKWLQQTESKVNMDYNEPLEKIINKLDKDVSQILNELNQSEVNTEESCNFYKYVSSINAISEASINFGLVSQKIDWDNLKEEHF
jgi:hypothetical protein